LLRTSLRLLALAALALWGPGCERHSQEADKPAQARDAVRRFFAALPDGDCAVLGRMLLLARPAQDCGPAVVEMNRHGLRLVDVLGAEVDGRNPDAVIVRARVEEGGKPKDAPLLIRAEKHPDGWKLRL
jgi:hypothetical protein